jgi:Baseplate wedge protein gp25
MIEQILFTDLGERVNRPTFGSGINQLVFAPNSNELAAATQLLVQGALQQWLADLIHVESVAVKNSGFTPSGDGTVLNMALFAVVPVIDDNIDPVTLTRGSKLTIKFKPAISSEQDANVIISIYKPLEVERITSDTTTTETLQVTIPADYETNKDFPVRLIVNGVESQPDEEKWNNEFKRPVVRITG